MKPSSSTSRPATCPAWCGVRHGQHVGEDDNVHVSVALLVKQSVLRLCATIDPVAGTVDGPYVLIDSREFSLSEVNLLLDALTDLVEEGTAGYSHPNEAEG